MHGQSGIDRSANKLQRELNLLDSRLQVLHRIHLVAVKGRAEYGLEFARNKLR